MAFETHMRSMPMSKDRLYTLQVSFINAKSQPDGITWTGTVDTKALLSENKNAFQ